jgi:predicted MFS family arabinose efflux permease
LAAALLPETRRPGGEPRARTISARAFAQALAHPRVGLLVALTFVITTAFALMESTFTLFADHVHRLDAVALGRMFGVAGVVAILVQGGLIGRLVRRFGEERLVPLGVALMSVGLALLPLAPPTAGLVAVFILISLGQSLVTPSLNSLVSRAAGDAQGFLLGTNQSMGALARAVGPALGGLLFTGWSPRGPFWFGAALLAGCVGLAVAATRRASDRAPAAP